MAKVGTDCREKDASVSIKKIGQEKILRPSQKRGWMLSSKNDDFIKNIFSPFIIHAVIAFVGISIELITKFFCWLVVEVYFFIGIMMIHIIMSPYTVSKIIFRFSKWSWNFWKERQALRQGFQRTHGPESLVSDEAIG